ncbi:hypothetical protein RI367_002415 [Sorochytrium milnesiophthora]
MASLWRLLTFADADRVVSSGNTRELEIDDALPLNAEDNCSVLKQKLEACWDRELQQSASTPPKFWRALARTFAWRYSAVALIALGSSLCKLASALVLGRFIHFLQTPDAPVSQGIPYAVGLLVAMACLPLFENIMMFQSTRVGINAKSSVVSLLYAHVLRLSLSTLPPVGQTLNIISNDVQRLETGGPYLMFIVLAPLETIIVFSIAWSYLSYAAAAAFGTLVAVVLLVGSLSPVYASLRKRVITARDSRIKLLNDILRSIEMLKMYAWEKPFSAKVGKWRMREVHALRRWYAIKGVGAAFFMSTLGFMSLAGFFTLFFGMHETFTPDKIFTSLLLFTLVQHNMCWRIPLAIETMADLRVSMARIQSLLLIQPTVRESIAKGDSSQLVAAGTPLVTLKNATFSWTPKTPFASGNKETDYDWELKARSAVLHDIDLCVQAGQCVAVIGAVGQGKSSLLLSLLRHTRMVGGDMEVSPHLSYVPQSSYIFAGTIKSNITMGEPEDAARLDRVIDICELRRDVAQWENGLDTRVGERGVRVSGGQKARVCLARALYHEAPLYLFDDIFSALDALVASAIFANLKQHMGDKALVIVTHHLGLVRQCDHVVLLEEGRVLAQGPYADVVADASRAGGHFAEVLAEVGHGDQAHTVGSVATLADAAGDGGLEMNEDGEDDEAWDEQRAKGTVNARVYREFFRNGSSLGFFLLVNLVGAMATALQTLGDWWLSRWASHRPDEQRDPMYWRVYTAIIFAVPLLAGLSTFGFYFTALSSSNQLFSKMLANILRATPHFFTTNPPGRILNRFAKDVSMTDEMLPDSLYEVIRTTLYIFSILVVICIAVPWLLLALVPVGVAFIWLRGRYLTANRQIRRIESLSRSPVYAHLVSSIEGMTTLTAHGLEQTYYKRFCDLQDTNIRSLLSFYMVERWLCLRVDALALVIVLVTTVAMICLRHSLTPGMAGLAQMYVLSLVDQTQFLVRKAAELELQFVAAERILEYASDIPLEAALLSDKAKEPPANWPHAGNITLDHMTLQYQGSQTPSLRDLSLHVAAGEKVGIVGRTGAGKSSIINCLFRLAEPSPAGSITIDGVNISDIGLHDLRSRLSIIPQSLFLFQGSVRYNLDPLEQFTDKEVWEALAAVKLKGAVELMTGRLEDEARLSAGEGQLLQLARVILRKSKVLVLDECSSNVDVATDRTIQRTIRERFREATVLTIAHRIDTILDNDKILVLDRGEVAEYGPVPDLLQNQGGIFRSLAEQSLGSERLARLLERSHGGRVAIEELDEDAILLK